MILTDFALSFIHLLPQWTFVKKNCSNRRRKNCEGAKASNFYKSKDKNLFTQLLPITQPTALEPLLQGWLISASSRTFMTHWDAVLSKLLVVWSIGLKIRPHFYINVCISIEGSEIFRDDNDSTLFQTVN